MQNTNYRKTNLMTTDGKSILFLYKKKGERGSLYYKQYGLWVKVKDEPIYEVIRYGSIADNEQLMGIYR